MCAVLNDTILYTIVSSDSIIILVYSAETASYKKKRKKKNLSVKSKKYDTNHLNIILQKASSILRTCRVSEDAIHKEGKTSYTVNLTVTRLTCMSD